MWQCQWTICIMIKYGRMRILEHEEKLIHAFHLLEDINFRELSNLALEYNVIITIELFKHKWYEAGNCVCDVLDKITADIRTIMEAKDKRDDAIRGTLWNRCH